MRKPVFIRGQAVSCAAGSTPAHIVASLRQRVCQLEHVELTALSPETRRPFYRLPGNRHLPPSLPKSRSEFYRTLFDTADRALNDAGIRDAEREDMALFLGSTSLDFPVYESICSAAGQRGAGILTQTTTGYGRIADDLAAHLGALGPCYTFTTACTSSANALIYAAEMIQAKRFRQALVVGVEGFSQLSLYGFESLGLIARDLAKPIGGHLGGMIIGEGCGAVVLDSRSGGKAGFAFLGGANRCDPHRVTTHEESGAVMAEVMRTAMASAGVGLEEITAVKVHATGNIANDKAEINGLKTVFGAKMPPLTGLKSYIGHTLGACGVIEMILLSEAVTNGFIPATPKAAPALPKTPAFLIRRHLPVRQGIFLINHFGFGGSCAAIVAANRS